MAIIAEKDEKTKTLFFFFIKLPREENHWTNDTVFQKTSPPVCHILKTAPLLRETVSQNDLFRLLRFEGKQGAS